MAAVPPGGRNARSLADQPARGPRDGGACPLPLPRAGTAPAALVGPPHIEDPARPGRRRRHVTSRTVRGREQTPKIGRSAVTGARSCPADEERPCPPATSRVSRRCRGRDRVRVVPDGGPAQPSTLGRRALRSARAATRSGPGTPAPRGSPSPPRRPRGEPADEQRHSATAARGPGVDPDDGEQAACSRRLEDQPNLVPAHGGVPGPPAVP